MECWFEKSWKTSNLYCRFFCFKNNFALKIGGEKTQPQFVIGEYKANMHRRFEHWLRHHMVGQEEGNIPRPPDNSNQTENSSNTANASNQAMEKRHDSPIDFFEIIL